MSGPPCPESIPSYYPITLHSIAAISVPINLIGFYLVWFQSPKMQGYKHCLCYLQFVSFLTEMHMSWICPGYYFFPMIGGFNTGAKIISSHSSMTLYVFILAFEIPSSLLCFISRHVAAKRIHFTPPRKMYPEKTMIFLTHVFPFAAATGMWNSNLTYEQKYDFVKNNWPQCLPWMKLKAFEVYDHKLNPLLAVTGIGATIAVCLVYTYSFTLGIHTMAILQEFRKSMSRQTYQMHKTALLSLFLQLLVPGIVLVVPLIVCMTVVITGAVGMQELATNTMFLVGSHSLCSCTIMIFSNPRYRKVLKERLSRIFGLMKLTNPATTVEPTRVQSVGLVRN